MPMTTSNLHAKDKRTADARPQLEHRHFAIVARIISRCNIGMRRAIALHFANNLETSNKKFDRERFLHACGVGDDS